MYDFGKVILPLCALLFMSIKDNYTTCVRLRKPEKCRSPYWQQQDLIENFTTVVIDLQLNVYVPKDLSRTQVQKFPSFG